MWLILEIRRDLVEIGRVKPGFLLFGGPGLARTMSGLFQSLGNLVDFVREVL